MGATNKVSGNNNTGIKVLKKKSPMSLENEVKPYTFSGDLFCIKYWNQKKSPKK